MFLAFSKWCVKLALFAPLALAPFFAGETFSFPANGFFPFISFKAIFFRVVIELGVFSLILHLLFSATRREQFQLLLRRLRHPIALAVIAFALLFLITAFTGINPTNSLWSNFERGEGAFQVLHYALFFLLIFVLFVKKEELYRLIKLNLIVSFIMCLYALPQFFEIQNTLHTIGSNGRVSGTLGNPSYLAAYLLINFAFIIFAISRAKTRTQRAWLFALFAFEFFTFLNTGTRGAYVALAAGAIVIYILNIFITSNPKTRMRLLVVLVGLLAFGAAGIGAYASFPKLQNILVLNRLFDVKGAVTGFEPRSWTWGSAIEGIKEKPILGWGAENYPNAFDKYYNPKHYGIESFFDRTHNVFLEYLISGGMVLFLAYLAIFYYYYRSLKGRPKNFWYSVLVAMPIVYFIQGFFLFDVLPIYVILFLFLAFVVNSHPTAEETGLTADPYELRHTALLTATGLLALLIFLIIITSVLPWKKNQLITRAYSLPRDNPEAVFGAFQDAILYNALVGQEEAVSGLTKYSIELLEGAAQQGGAVPEPIVRGIVDTNNAWFDEYQKIFPGLRDWYLNGGLNVRAGASFGIPEYLSRGKQLYHEALRYAPKRIEFIHILLETARAERDEATFNVLFRLAAELRPDIDWQAFDQTPLFIPVSSTPATAGN